MNLSFYTLAYFAANLGYLGHPFLYDTLQPWISAAFGIGMIFTAIPPLLTTDQCSSCCSLQTLCSCLQETKAKALITLDRCCFANLFALVILSKYFLTLFYDIEVMNIKVPELTYMTCHCRYQTFSGKSLCTDRSSESVSSRSVDHMYSSASSWSSSVGSGPIISRMISFISSQSSSWVQLLSGQVVEDIEHIALQTVGKFLLLDPKLEVAPSTNLITDLLTVRVHALTTQVFCNWTSRWF